MTRVYAAADIGSNTAHLLVAATDGSLVMRIDNYNEWIALGETVAKTGSIQKEQFQQLVSAVKEFKRLAREKQAHSMYVFATEAMRSASNCLEVIKRISSDTGILVEIISPRREAELSLGGVRLDTKHMGAELLLEVGGGSAQIGRIKGSGLSEEESLRLGTGRVIAECGLTNPPTPLQLRAAASYIHTTLESSRIEPGGDAAVASGGVARGLWRALHPDGEKTLSLEEIDYMVWAASRLPLDRIMMRFGVKARRAGTMLAGALIYQALMKKFNFNEMVVSEFGIREGAVLKMATEEIVGCPV